MERITGGADYERTVKRQEELAAFFKAHAHMALAFSGGVDSAYLLYAGLRAGADIRPYYCKTVFQPQFEYEDAKRLARELDVELTTVELDILSVPKVADNPPDRCYHCKSALFGALKKRAAKDGRLLLLDGTNASDDEEDRPGMRALRELGVRSPLQECGFTKEEIRRCSKEAGLFTWNKPAYACLATRVPAENTIEQPLLRRVENAENALFKLGYTDFRVRVFHNAARLQLNIGQMARAAAEAERIRDALRPYFETVLLDMAGRKTD
ncbi:MAG: ATP-dependent sacrificial sulfur transferase LarE [Eubacteriales bacterium]|nr:ATP-dependent sacrificial sulfur transferase LarE [Eubacteriales bacterium]